MLAYGIDTINEALKRNAEQYGDDIAFRFIQGGTDEKSITYAELYSRALQIASQFRLAEIPLQSKVLILYPSSLEYICTLFGCFLAGTTAIPAYPPVFNRSLSALRNIVLDSGATIACVESAIREQLQPLLHTESWLENLNWMTPEEDVDDAVDTSALPDVAPEDLAVLQYTSGSTSAPKGVMLSHRNLVANAHMLMARVQATARVDRMVAWLPPFHDMGLIGSILAPVCARVESTLMPPSSFIKKPLRWLEAISRYRGTITAAPDFAYEMCVHRTPPKQRELVDLSSLRVALNGAEKVREDTLNLFCDAFKSQGFSMSAFAPSYGLAEATLGVAIKRNGNTPLARRFDTEKLKEGLAVPVGGDDGTSLVTCGKPLDGVDVKIVSIETRQVVTPGMIGEIWVRSASVSRGYWQKIELSREIFEGTLPSDGRPDEKYLATGDLGFLYDNELYVTGRHKDLIIVLGVNHYPEDIEKTVESAHPAIRQHTVIAFALPINGTERVVVTTEIARGNEFALDDIIGAIRNAISTRHQLPVYDIVLLPQGGQVARTTSGKPRRSASRQKYEANGFTPLGSSQMQQGTESGSPAEEIAVVQRVMAEVLSVDRVSADDDFFALGGHSLIATQLASRLASLWEREVPVRVIFERPTAARLAGVRHSLPVTGKRNQIQKVDRSGPLVLSHSQERMWLLHQLEPDGTAYNVSGAVVVDGPFNVVHCQTAMQRLVDRHETLRTTFPSEGGTVSPMIHSNVKINVVCEDLSSADDPLEQAARKGSLLAHRPFDLARDLLIRVAIFKVADVRHAIVISMHHVISDAWSLGVVLKEIMEDYLALNRGEVPTSVVPDIQYVDYAAWFRPVVESERFNDELSYWRNRLQGTPNLELPTDRSPGSNVSSAGEMERLQISETLRNEIEDLAHQHGATPFMVMLLAFETLLYRYSRQTDFAIGVPIANRNHHQSEHLVGTLVNTLAFRANLNPKEAFSAQLERIREDCLDAYAHQQLPFERLVQELHLERRAGQTPLVQVMFDYANPPMPKARTDEFSLSPLFISRRAAQFDLSLLTLDSEIGFVTAMEYRSDLFDASTVRRMLDHYLRILKLAVTNPTQRLCDMAFLSQDEIREIVALGASTNMKPVSSDTTVARIVAGADGVTGKMAVTDEVDGITYGRLMELTRTAAAKMAAANVAAGSRVAVCLERSRLMPAALLAVHWLDAAYVPIDPHFPAERVRYMLSETTPAVVVCDEATTAAYPELAQYPCLRIEDVVQSEPLTPPPLTTRPDSTAYIIFTSGSTGKPKGVEIPQRAMLNFLESMAHTPGMTATDRLLSVTTISFDISVLEIFLPLLCQAEVKIVGSDTALNAQKLRGILEETDVTVMQATPVTWRMLIESGWAGSDLLTVLCGGEAMPADLAEQLVTRSKALWNMYGPTETTVWSTVQQIRTKEAIDIGRSIDRTAVYILDATKQLCPIGVTGEIYIGGAGVAKGYFKRPELTQERFVKDPFTPGFGDRMYGTGDLGRMRSDGTFECFGRLDHQVKIRGYRIELGEIEVALKQLPEVADAVVIPWEVTPGDARLSAYIIAEGTAPESEQLRNVLRKSLPGYMVPSWFTVMAQFPTTPNGKIDRKALPGPDAKLEVQSPLRVAPRSETEKALAVLWARTLDVTHPSITDNFFDVGHSLLAARLFGQIEKEMGVSLPLSVLFSHPTIEMLSAYIDGQVDELGYYELKYVVPIKPRGRATPVFCIHGAGGNVLNFESLARHIDADCPLYAIQARGVHGTETPFDTIEKTASAYLEEVMEIQPTGPYIIMGYCAGGVVAFEMARQIQLKGDMVRDLILIDTFRPGVGYTIPSFGKRVLRAATKGPGHFFRHSFSRLHRIKEDNANLKALNRHLSAGEPVPHELRTLWLTRAFLDSVEKYQLPVYDGALTIFEAADVPSDLVCSEPNLGWDGYAASISCTKVPGGHLTLTDEPNAKVLATELCNRLHR